jgi:hypothetical protein
MEEKGRGVAEDLPCSLLWSIWRLRCIAGIGVRGAQSPCIVASLHLDDGEDNCCLSIARV